MWNNNLPLESAGQSKTTNHPIASIPVLSFKDIGKLFDLFDSFFVCCNSFIHAVQLQKCTVFTVHHSMVTIPPHRVNCSGWMEDGPGTSSS